MRDVQTNGQPLNSTSYCPFPGNQPDGPSRGKKFVSTDGSGATAIFYATRRSVRLIAGEWAVGSRIKWLTVGLNIAHLMLSTVRVYEKQPGYRSVESPILFRLPREALMSQAPVVSPRKPYPPA